MLRLRPTRRAALVAAALLLAAGEPGAAQTRSTPEAFATDWADTVLSGARLRRMALLHPASRACMTERNRAYFDWIFANQTRTVAPGARRVTAQAVTPSTYPVADDGAGTYPVAPTHSVQIDFLARPQSAASVVILIAPDGPEWREVLPCPGAKAAQLADQKAVDTARQSRAVDDLVRGLSPAVRDELVGLLAAGRKIDAVRRYQSLSSQDLTTSRDVVEALAASASSGRR